MTQNIFNLYSASIFSEHPSALWTLDDDFSFISLIGASAQWSIDAGYSSSVQYEPSTSPIETTGVGQINAEIETFVSDGSSNTMEISCQSFNSIDDIDYNKRTASVSSFIFPYNANISSISIGMKYYDDETDEWIYDTSEYLSPTLNQWEKIGHTFKAVRITNLYDFDENTIDPVLFPRLDADYFPIIIVEFNEASADNYFSIYNFSVGQWSEQFTYETTGSVVEPLINYDDSTSLINSLSINISDISLIDLYQIDAYGFSDSDYGYYWVYENKMLARNTKLPMVFGSGNITELYPSGVDNIPSVTIPGKGFLHENGKYKELTAEFWLRINSSSDYEKKIFGPLNSEDGIYVDKDFITIKVGHKRKSYFINKWYRPMLIDFRYNPFFVSLLINGDEVASIDITPQDTLFPSNQSTYDTDWLGFFVDESSQPFEIDAVAIYPYIVSEQAAKRKFVYGQGVGKPEEIIKRFNGISTTIDFPFAEYTKNVIYPDMTRWSQGYYSNLNATSKYLSLPEYELPEITYVGDDLQPFTLPRLVRTWLGIKESSLWGDWRSGVWRSISTTREANPLVDNYDLQSELTEDFYLKITPNSVYDQLYGAISFKTMNPLNENVASILGVFSLNSTEPEDIQNDTNIMTLFYFKNRSTGEYFDIVIELEYDGDDVSAYYVKYRMNGETIESQNLPVTFQDTTFIAGLNIETFTNTYKQYVKNFFANPQNIILNVGGNDRNEFTGKIYRVTFNNKFFTRKDLGNYFMTSGAAKCRCSVTPDYFETFKSYVGNYTLLFRKSNSSMIMDIGSAGYWENSIPMSSLGSYIADKDGNLSYYDLDAIQFNIDYPSSIYSVDNFSNDSSNIKTYISVQSYQDAGTINYENFTETKDLDEKRYVDLDNQEDNIDITKYSVIDGTLLFPPKSKIDFKDAYITLHMEMKSDGIKTSPVNLQRMSLASLAFDQKQIYSINSPTGNKFYPFTRQGASYSTKIKNPFLIYKDSTPYLYLTSDSGATSIDYSDLVGNDSNYTRGLSLAINPKKKESYDVYGFHIWINYNGADSISERQKAFSIYSNDRTVNFYIEPEVGYRRAKILPYLYEISGEEIDENTHIYQNGVETEAYLYPMSWSLVTVRFDEPMSFDNTIGQLEIYPNVIFNNVAIYESDIYGKVDDIFESHLGLSNIVAQDSSVLSVDSDGLDVFNAVSWSTFTGKPV